MWDLVIGLTCLNSLAISILGVVLWRRSARPKQGLPRFAEFLGNSLFPLTERKAQMRRELGRARRYERPLTVAVLEVFKPPARRPARADEPLEWPSPSVLDSLAVGTVTVHALRGSDIVAYNAAEDRFVLCLPEVGRSEAEQLMERISNLVDQRTRTSVRAGVAELASDGWTLEDLLSQAVGHAKGFRAKGKATGSAVGVGA